MSRTRFIAPAFAAVIGTVAIASLAHDSVGTRYGWRQALPELPSLTTVSALIADGHRQIIATSAQATLELMKLRKVFEPSLQSAIETAVVAPSIDVSKMTINLANELSFQAVAASSLTAMGFGNTDTGVVERIAIASANSIAWSFNGPALTGTKSEAGTTVVERRRAGGGWDANGRSKSGKVAKAASSKPVKARAVVWPGSSAQPTAKNGQPICRPNVWRGPFA